MRESFYNIMDIKEYLKWFVGFVDAEGNFYINKNCDTQTFSIHLSIKDKENLYQLKKILNFGQVYEDKKNNRVLFSVSKKEILNLFLIPIFNEFPLLTRKLYQYEAWKEILIKRINKEKFNKLISYDKTSRKDITVQDLKNKSYFDSWMIGFIEGEGSFMIINDNHTSRPKFSICQKYDKIILEAIREKLNMKAKVFLEKENFYRLTIRSKKDLTTLIKFIAESKIKFQGYKGKQYQDWCKKIEQLEQYKDCLKK